MARFRKRVSHAKEAFYIICILVVLLVGLYSYFGPGGYLEMKRTQAELEMHRARVEQLRQFNDARMREIKLLRDDDGAIERYARKKGYGRKDEIIQEIPPQTPDLRPQTSDQKQNSGGGTQKK